MRDVKIRLPSGALVILSGPSGVGKNDLINVIRKSVEFVFSVSATTREPRSLPSGETEVNGIHYYFITRAEFQARVAAGHFVEHKTVHGNYYGTLVSEVVGPLEKGNSLILDIDVAGHAQISQDERFRDRIISFFIFPPSREEHVRRLRKRGGLTDDQIEVRLKNAEEEVTHAGEFTYQVINGDLLETAETIVRKLLDHLMPVGA